MARQPSSASMTSRSPGSQLWQVDTGAVLPHDATTVVRDTPALPGASVVVRPLSGGEIQVGRQAGASDSEPSAYRAASWRGPGFRGRTEDSNCRRSLAWSTGRG